jgi:pyruvate formate lyase activating enzyme
MNAIQGIKGFLGTSLIDYPGKVAAVVFLAGCNLRCPYCHNSILVRDDENLEDLHLQELIDGLQRRRKLLDGVVVTGGEPTIHPQLSWLLKELKSTGLAVKLDTNGLRPQVLSELLEAQLLDYVAVDLKLAPDRYFTHLGGPQDSARRLEGTIELLRRETVDYEFRTTCVPGLVSEQDIEQAAKLITGARAYYLQQYIPIHVYDPSLAERPPFPREVLERFLEVARPYVQRVELRNL